MTRNKTSIVVGLIGVIGGALLGLGAGYQLWAGGAGETQRIPIEGSEKKAMIKKEPSSAGVLSVWLPPHHRTMVRIPDPKIGEYEGESGFVSIDRRGEGKKLITTIRVRGRERQVVLSAGFYPENGAIKYIGTRTPEGDFIGTAEFRKDGTVKSLQRNKSNKKSTKWKFDREGNIIDKYNVTDARED
ncbi:MAG: hypothetical protein ACLFWL_14845 [Candidatus Brocadiia bacterium]